MANPIAHLPGTDSYLDVVRMMRDPGSFFDERFARWGPVFKTRFIVPVAVVVGPEANKTIHVTRRLSFSYKEGFRGTGAGKILENSLLAMDGEEHQRDRDILQPAVGRLAIQRTLEIVGKVWQRAADSLTDGQVFDVHTFARDATFEVSATALVGMEPEDLEPYKPLFETFIHGSLANVDWRVPFGKLDRGLSARERLLTRLIPRIEQAREREPNGMMGLLAHHRQADGSQLDVRRIAEHLLFLFWAGYDTTAAASSWLLYELSRVPEWQERIAGEIKGQIDGAAPSLEALDKVTTLSWALKELERLRPSVMVLPRRTVESVEINGHAIPKDTFMFYSPYLTHRMPDLFPEPARFNPDRWNPAHGKAVAPQGALVGFGGGPRICLGKAFALMQLKVAAAAILRKVRVEPDQSSPEKIVCLPMYRLKNARLIARKR